MIHPAIENAYKVLEGETLIKTDALCLAHEVHQEDILDLVSLANKVRKKFAAPIDACSIVNAKSGKCSQNCSFCAQSSFHATAIETYPLLDKSQVLEAAEKVYASGIRKFGYVTSGLGYLAPNEEFLQILDTLDLLHEKFPDLQLCVSVGILNRETARLLSEHHVWRYNMNLQTSPLQYERLIADSHSIDAKIATIKYLQEFGITNCTGGIFGLDESWEDRIDMALAIRELDVEGIPLNVLLPIPGTKLENLPAMKPADVTKAFAIVRLINPSKMTKFAAGRETLMKDFQCFLMLAGANSLITGGYLTTRGRSVSDNALLIEQLGEFDLTTTQRCRGIFCGG